MTNFDFNLSTRPFPAYRLFNLGLAGILIILVLVSIWQGLGFVRFQSMAQAIRPEEQNIRVEAESRDRRVAELESRLDRPDAAAKLSEIAFLNQLMARKELSWTGLFANLEDVVPDNVYLANLTPGIGDDGVVVLSIQARGRSISDVTEFVERLEKSPIFEKLAVSVEEKRQSELSTDVQVQLTTNYYPEREIR